MNPVGGQGKSVGKTPLVDGDLSVVGMTPCLGRWRDPVWWTEIKVVGNGFHAWEDGDPYSLK